MIFTSNSMMKYSGVPSQREGSVGNVHTQFVGFAVPIAGVVIEPPTCDGTGFVGGQARQAGEYGLNHQPAGVIVP